MMQSLAILLTVYNRKPKTLQCLQNLYAQLPVEDCEVEVYLTDDGCTDGTPEAVGEQFPQVNIIRADGNLFWNRGMYTAWKKAAETKDYDFYLWLNDDTFVYPGMMALLLKGSEAKRHKAIIVGATQSLGNGEPTYGGRLADGTIPVPQGEMVQVSHFNGNIVLIPKSVFHTLGNLDDYFTHSKGDFDYGLRAGKAGIEMYQVGAYLGKCDSHETIDKWCDPDIPFRQRWKMLHRPNGMPPKETFHLEKRHNGFVKAAFHYCTIHVRCIFPAIWILLKK